MRLVKVLWQHRGVEEATWEHEDQCVPLIISYLRMKVRCLVIWYLNDCCICMRMSGYVCNFKDEIF